jgi:hypothetical protein
MNALKSGIYSKSEIIPGEDPARLATLTEEYFQRFCPALPEEREQVDILVRSAWSLRRLAVAEAQLWAYEMERAYHLDEDSPIGHAFSLADRTLTRLQRMVNSTQRNFRDALHELERLRALPPEVPCPKPGPTLVPDPPKSPQKPETKPVDSSREFVSSTSTPPPPAARKAAKPLTFHLPDRPDCHFTPAVPAKFKRCPFCYPDDCYPDDQE